MVTLNMGGSNMGRTRKWYNMQQIDMSGEMLMGCAEKVPQVRYSAAYPTGAERMFV